MKEKCFTPFFAIIFLTALLFQSCEKKLNNISRYAGTWDFENHYELLAVDSNVDPNHLTVILDTTFHYIGKIIYLKEEGPVLRLVYNDKDTVEIMVNDLGEIHNCWWFSSACIYRGFDFFEIHGNPAGYFTDYDHLGQLYMYSVDVHTTTNVHINGTKILE